MFLTKAFMMSSQPGENSYNIQLSETFTRQYLLDAGLENSKSNIVVETGGGGYLPCLHTGVRVPCFVSEISLESHFFGSKICNMNFPILGGKQFQQLSFLLNPIL